MADVAAAQMSRMTLDIAPTIVDKRPPGTAGRPLELNTNITPLTLKQNVTYYMYDVRMNAIFTKDRDGSEIVKEFAKQTKDDYNEQERKKACTEIFMYLTQNEELFQGDLIYDRAAILFSTTPLEGIAATGQQFTLPPTVQTVCPDAIRIEVTIKPVTESFKVTSDQLVACANADFKKNQSKALLEVLNLATSQIPFFSPNEFITYGNGNIYLLDPARYGFHENEAPPIMNDKFTGIGLSKGVKILEGNSAPGRKDYMPAMVLDVKKTAFHLFNQVLTDKIRHMYGASLPRLANLERDLKDLRCITTYKRASIVIGGFTKGAIKDASFRMKNGQERRVIEYYEAKYHLKIQNVDLPGVIDKHHKAIYPTDLLKVASFQRVKATQATKETVEALIKVSAIKPDVRYQQTKRLATVLQLSSEKSERLGVSVQPNQESLVVPARVLNAVKLQGPGGASMTGPLWRGAPKFVVGAKIEKWAAFLLYNGTARYRHPANEAFERFLHKFVETGNRKGMQIPPPLKDSCDVTKCPTPVSVAMKMAADAGCTYVLFVSDERIKEHDQLKYEELVYKITTQEVTLAKAAQVGFENKMQTMENIIMKTNVKLRGMNHIVAPDHGLHHATDTCIMGLYIAQPRGMTAEEAAGESQPAMPAVIGLSANNGHLQEAPEAQRVLAAQQYFTTAWKFANPKEWNKADPQRDTLSMMIIDALKQFDANRGHAPKKVIVYRGGVSEGQLPYLAGAERDAFLAAFHHLSPEYNPYLVIIACSKEHNERFYHKVFPSAAPGAKVDTNLPPGVIVDRVAVNPELNEFYLQSHKALQGTAKATKYTLLHESSGKLSNDHIQYMTNALCHLHQIVNSTTSIPTPLYVAEESAKRAANIYHLIKGPCHPYDLEEINRDLSPQGLASRINA